MASPRLGGKEWQRKNKALEGELEKMSKSVNVMWVDHVLAKCTAVRRLQRMLACRFRPARLFLPAWLMMMMMIRPRIAFRPGILTGRSVSRSMGWIWATDPCR